MNNVSAIMIIVFLVIYDIQFLRNIEKQYFKHKPYIVPFSVGMLLLNIFFLGFIYDELFGEVQYMLLFLPMFGIGLTLHMYGFRELLILKRNDNPQTINNSSIDTINKWLPYLYVCNVAAVIVFVIMFY